MEKHDLRNHRQGARNICDDLFSCRLRSAILFLLFVRVRPASEIERSRRL